MLSPPPLIDSSAVPTASRCCLLTSSSDPAGRNDSAQGYAVPLTAATVRLSLLLSSLALDVDGSTEEAVVIPCPGGSLAAVRIAAWYLLCFTEEESQSCLSSRQISTKMENGTRPTATDAAEPQRGSFHLLEGHSALPYPSIEWMPRPARSEDERMFVKPPPLTNIETAFAARFFPPLPSCQKHQKHHQPQDKTSDHSHRIRIAVEVMRIAGFLQILPLQLLAGYALSSCPVEAVRAALASSPASDLDGDDAQCETVGSSKGKADRGNSLGSEKANNDDGGSITAALAAGFDSPIDTVADRDGIATSNEDLEYSFTTPSRIEYSEALLSPPRTPAPLGFEAIYCCRDGNIDRLTDSTVVERQSYFCFLPESTVRATCNPACRSMHDGGLGHAGQAAALVRGVKNLNRITWAANISGVDAVVELEQLYRASLLSPQSTKCWRCESVTASLALENASELLVGFNDATKTTIVCGSARTRGHAAPFRTFTLPGVTLDCSRSTFESVKAHQFTGIDAARLVLPPTVVEVRPYAFSGCFAPVDLSACDKVNTLPSKCFSGARAAPAALPPALRSIQSSAMCVQCSAQSESKIVVPATVTAIEESAFREVFATIDLSACHELKEIATSTFARVRAPTVLLPPNIKTLGPHCFSSARIGTIDLSSCCRLTEVMDSAFDGFIGEVIMPSSLQTLGERGFKGFRGKLDLSQTVITTIPTKCFASAQIPTLGLPSTLAFVASDACNRARLGEATVTLTALMDMPASRAEE